MKKYYVEVNHVPYEVVISEITGENPAPGPAAAAAPKTEAEPKAGAEAVKAPMPGTILKVNVTAGQSVKSGDVLMILEAMKMENEIMAPKDGTVASVDVQAGSSVENGTLLCSIS
ncbi:biotin/lipoyl-containing protein [Lacrimispora sp.]|uniref:biotin/lipoyl-containing protein n=1 Tax=Lacrimispora sp. TaxID=2719234 RepID=UPI003460785B